MVKAGHPSGLLRSLTLSEHALPLTGFGHSQVETSYSLARDERGS
jgi:hypothetical protein